MGFLLAAVLLGVIGYLLRFRQWGWLASGYKTSSKAAKARYDLAALTRGGLVCYLPRATRTLGCPALSGWG